MTVNLYLNDVLKDTRTVTLSQQGDSVTLTWPGLHSVTITLASVTAPPSPSDGRIDEYKVTQIKYAQGVALSPNTWRTVVRVSKRITAYYTDWYTHQTTSDRVDLPGSPDHTSRAYYEGNTWTEENYHEPNWRSTSNTGEYNDALRESSTTINLRLVRSSFSYLPIRNGANAGLVRGNTTQLVLRDGDA